ncbi:MAG: rubredoxin, partial [bacterium]|nr:rubredoxin [bacterium]
MAKYICGVCEYVHDEEKTGQKWDELPEEWVCPVCESPKSYFTKADEAGSAPESHDDKVEEETDAPVLIDLQKTMAEAE